jgi:hypothetical protein
MLPRLGYLKTAGRILPFRIIVDTTSPNYSLYPIEGDPNWKDFYPDTEEETPIDLPTQKALKVRMTIFVGADHTHDLALRSSITDSLAMLDNKSVR